MICFLNITQLIHPESDKMCCNICCVYANYYKLECVLNTCMHF